MVVSTLNIGRELSNIDDNEVTNMEVIPKDSSKVTQLKDLINIRFKGELQALNMQESASVITSFIDNLRIALWAISGIAGVVGGIVVTNTMLMSVMERMKEFGVLKAIGWQNYHVIKMIISESIILSIIGGILGVILGILISMIADYYTKIPSVITIDLIIQALLFALIMGIVGGIYPAIKSAKMSPVEATRA
jgi:putative ABC transport system permease protein